MVLTIDQFTDTNGTLLEAHAPDAGGEWVKHPSYETAISIIDNQVRVDASGTALYYHTWTPDTAEYEVLAKLTALSTTTISDGIVARVDPSANTLYGLRWNSGSWNIFRFVAGSFASLATSEAYPLALSQSYILRFEITDAAKIAYVDDVEVCRSTDNTITAKGYPGLRLLNTTGTRWDDFAVDGDGSIPSATAPRPSHVFVPGSPHNIGPLTPH